MRWAMMIFLLVTGGAGYAKDLDSVGRDAWRYLTKDDGAAWIVIESSASGRYVQCANMGDFLRCPFPVRISIRPSVQYFASEAGRGTPYPDVDGARKKVYIDPAQVELLKNAIKEQGLEPVDVYSRVVDEKEQVVGTSYDVVVVFEPEFDGFVPFVRHVFETAWGAGSDDEYTVEMGH